MKIIKKLSPIMESISNVGKDKKKMLDEEFDVNHPIGVLPHADAVAMEQHIADRAAGLERRANPDKVPLVKELIDETASEKSRTLHYDVVDRKGLAKILTEAKKNKQKFKVGKSDKAGYRYFVDILPIYGSEGALEVDDGDTEVDGETLTESLHNDDIYYIYEFYYPDITNVDKNKMKEYGLEVLGKTGKYRGEENLAVKGKLDDLKEYCENYLGYDMHPDYLIPEDDFVSDYYDEESLEEAVGDVRKSPAYLKAEKDASKVLYGDRNAYGTIFGYIADDHFYKVTPKAMSQEEFKKYSKDLVKNNPDCDICAVYQSNLDASYDDADKEETKKFNQQGGTAWNDADARNKKGLNEEMITESYNSDILLDDILNWFDNHDQAKEDLIVYLKDNNYTDEDIKALFEIEDDVDGEPVDEDLDESCNKQVNEDLQLYASSLKDFKPAKEAEELWNEIIEKGKLDDLEYELENVFKADDDENASIDIEGLNDLLVNHQDFIRTLIGLDEAPLEDDDYNEKPVGDNEMVYYDDDEEPVDEDTPVDAEEDDIDVDDIEGVDEDEEDDVEPIYGEGEEKPTSTKWKKIESDEEDESEEGEPKDKTDKSETEEDKEEKKEEKVEESLNESRGKGFVCKYKDHSIIDAGDRYVITNKDGLNVGETKFGLPVIKDMIDDLVAKEESSSAEESLDKKEPEIKLDDEEDLEEGCERDLKECDSSKDDDLTENIANSFIKNRFTEAKDMPGMTDEEKRQELAKKSLQSLNESDEEVIDINDEELTEALGMPTEDQVKKEEPKVEQPKPEESKEEDKKGE